MLRTVTVVAVLLTLAGCASTPAADDLIGQWHGESENARGSTLKFEPGGRLRWTIDAGGGPMTVEATYATIPGTSPRHLDITGFSAGPLAGSALYCIYEPLSPDRIRMDCERGKVGDPSVRPAAFDEKQTQLFVRR